MVAGLTGAAAGGDVPDVLMVEVMVEDVHVMSLLQVVQAKALLKVPELSSLLSPLAQPQTTTP